MAKNTKKKPESTQSNIVRAVCFVLAALTVLALASTIIIYALH